MAHDDVTLYEGDTAFGHIQVVDTVYEGRAARVLYSGSRQAAQSGVPRDGNPELLFDYNQRFYELVSGLQPKKLLFIGGGVYTLPMALQAEFPDIQIDIVEIDPGLDEIATKYFGFKPSAKLRVFHTDGRQFLETSRNQYDMIIVDAFEHVTIPKSLSSKQAAALVGRHLADDGVVAINVIASYQGLNTATIHRLQAAYQTVFSSIEIFPAGKGYTLWLPQNLVLVAKNNEQSIGQYLRYSVLEPLTVSPSEALSDD